MMFAAALVLFSTVFLSSAAEQSIPEESRADAEVAEAPKSSGTLGGFEVVFKNRLLVAHRFNGICDQLADRRRRQHFVSISKLAFR